jgi:hypothetical protein
MADSADVIQAAFITLTNENIECNKAAHILMDEILRLRRNTVTDIDRLRIAGEMINSLTERINQHGV